VVRDWSDVVKRPVYYTICNADGNRDLRLINRIRSRFPSAEATCLPYPGFKSFYSQARLARKRPWDHTVLARGLVIKTFGSGRAGTARREGYIYRVGALRDTFLLRRAPTR